MQSYLYFRVNLSELAKLDQLTCPSCRKDRRGYGCLMLSLKCAKLPIFSSQSVRASEAGPADLSVLSERQAGLRVLKTGVIIANKCCVVYWLGGVSFLTSMSIPTIGPTKNSTKPNVPVTQVKIFATSSTILFCPLPLKTKFIII